MRRRLLVVIAALWLAACGPAEPLRIGFIAELTGRSADLAKAAATPCCWSSTSSGAAASSASAPSR
jgi:uncharacterized lipoprotein YmbA